MHGAHPLVQIWVYTFTHWATAHGFSLGLIQKVGLPIGRFFGPPPMVSSVNKA